MIEIKLFMPSQGKLVSELENAKRFEDLAFLVYMIIHLNDLNMSLQGKDKINSLF